MKIKQLLLILFVSCFSHAFSDTNQKNSSYEKYYLTAKVWGFLKYYHPNVANGSYDWDEELFTIIKKLDDIDTNSDFSNIILKWINSLGDISKCKECNNDVSKYFTKNFNLSWFNNSIFSKELSNKLKYIEQNRYQETQYYVAYAPAKNIKIINEKLYTDKTFPSRNIRLLNLFRYWNIIEYFYPYKYLLDHNWDKVLEEMIPIFINAKNDEEFKKAIKLLVARVDDSHAWVSFKNNKNTKHIPYKVKIIEDSLVVSGTYNKNLSTSAGLKYGDIILEVGGNNIYDEAEKIYSLIPASNKNTKRLSSFISLLQSNDNYIQLTVKRDGELLNQKVKTYPFKDFNYYSSESNKSHYTINNEIGYINMRVIGKKETLQTMKKFRNYRGIIFDIRGYTKTVFYQISRFLNSEDKEFAKILNPYLKYPSKFVWTNSIKTESNKNNFKGKIIILVDEQCISLSEFAAMCLSSSENSLVIGSQTVGADGNVSIFNFASGFKTAISGKGVYYPNKEETQRVGIKLDYKIKPSIKGLKEGKDEVLEKAIELIKSSE